VALAEADEGEADAGKIAATRSAQNEYRAPSCICQRLAPSSRASRSLAAIESLRGE